MSAEKRMKTIRTVATRAALAAVRHAESQIGELDAVQAAKVAETLLSVAGTADEREPVSGEYAAVWATGPDDEKL